jgi:hypothetical protein
MINMAAKHLWACPKALETRISRHQMAVSLCGMPLALLGWAYQFAGYALAVPGLSMHLCYGRCFDAAC